MPTALPTDAPAPVPPDDRRSALALALAPGIGPVRWRALMDRAAGRSADALRVGVPDGAARERALRDGEAALATARARGIGVSLVGEPDYPPALLDRPDAPPAIWWLGDPGLLGRAPVVAIVGTRRPTAYGARCAHALASALARAGALVVSGMARGIDAAAHEAALDAGGASVAVLGTGVDVPYPASNRALHGRLLRTGLVVAEALPGSAATPGAFPRRNRIIAALASLTIVVEAPVRSGALITAADAMELGRTVAAVPGAIDLPQAAGSNSLLRDGAHVIASVDDALALAGCATPAAAAPSSASAPPGLGPDEQAVWQALAQPAPGADLLVERTGLPAGRCVAALTTLELAGLIEARWSGELARR